jgi:diguanylate cyclase (GGDEF)-like protein
LCAADPAERARCRAALDGFDVDEIPDESSFQRDGAAAGDVLVVAGSELPAGCWESDRRLAIVWIGPNDADGPVDALLPPTVTDAELRECVELVGTRAALLREIEELTPRVTAAFDRHKWRGGGVWRSPRELLHLALSDPLTGVFNRRYLHEMLRAEFERATVSGQPTSLLILDLDKFKPINDTWGHRLGDLVLCEVAARLRQTTRGSDRVCRYGGDEFAVIAAGSELHAAALLAERLRLAISDTPVIASGREIRMTCSLGVASAPENAPNTADELLHLADLSMLAAKRRGGDAVQITSP